MRRRGRARTEQNRGYEVMPEAVTEGTRRRYTIMNSKGKRREDKNVIEEKLREEKRWEEKRREEKRRGEKRREDKTREEQRREETRREEKRR